MKNKALINPGRRLNKFTKAVKMECLEEGSAIVGLRNGVWVKVFFCKKDEKNGNEDQFISENYDYGIWDLSGKSITSRDLDMIKF